LAPSLKTGEKFVLCIVVYVIVLVIIIPYKSDPPFEGRFLYPYVSRGTLALGSKIASRMD
jgi:hypothetical protein